MSLSFVLGAGVGSAFAVRGRWRYRDDGGEGDSRKCDGVEDRTGRFVSP